MPVYTQRPRCSTNEPKRRRSTRPTTASGRMVMCVVAMLLACQTGSMMWELSTTPVRAAQGQGLVAALTFDDGPNGADTENLLDILRDHGIRAVFAVVGSQIQAPGGED